MQKVISLGCRLNRYEGNAIEDFLKNLDENWIVINSCTVTQEAEKDTIKAVRKAKRMHPSAKIAVVGCAPQANPHKYEAFPEIDLILGNIEKLDPSKYKYTSQKKSYISPIERIKYQPNTPALLTTGRTRGFLEIQNGCDHSCTFCIIPSGRGPNRSSDPDEVSAKAGALIRQGCIDITLTGVDITAYGSDVSGNISLPILIRKILSDNPRLSRLRLSSLDPAEISEEFFEIVAKEKRFMPHFHISLQSGNNMILKRMKRRHSRESATQFCKTVRDIRTEASFGADIIVGFPTETDEMFTDTLSWLEENKIFKIHPFPYSQRDGTPASRMPQVDKNKIKSRMREIINLGDKLKSDFLRTMISKDTSILIEKNTPKGSSGKTENFADVILHERIPSGTLLSASIIKEKDGLLIANQKNGNYSQ